MVWYNLDGTTKVLYAIGKGGPNLRHTSGELELRNNTDSAFATFRSNRIKLENGTVANPSLAFDDGAGNWDTGFYLHTIDEIGVSISGSQVARFDQFGLNVTDTVSANFLENVVSMNSGHLAGLRNLVINGAMTIAQRGTVTGVSADGYGGPDRFRFAKTGAVVVTLSQDSDAPDGFGSSLRVNVTTADASIAAGEFAAVQYKMEGQNLQHILKGTASAKQLTLSFWVKSPKAGTHIVELFDQDNARSVSSAYTVSAANTWEKQTLTFPADTTGALDNDANNSFDVFWWLAAGSNFSSGTLNTSWNASTATNRAPGQVNCVDSTANEFLMTGVQLEIGDTATEFEYRSYGLELSLCQRYYRAGRFTVDTISDGSNNVVFEVPMRATPTLTVSPDTGSGAGINLLDNHGFYQSSNNTVLSPADYTADAEL